ARQPDGEEGAMDATSFPGPLEGEIPAACEGWEDLYPRQLLFVDDRRTSDEERFCVQDAVHYSEPLYPFDAGVGEWTIVGLSQGQARLFVVPPSLGIEGRLLNGYAYLSATSVTDPTLVARRTELFEERAGFYYGHWADLDTRWYDKVEHEIREVEALE